MSHILDQVSRRASGYDPARVALLAVATPLIAVGWLAGLVVRSTWVAVAWMWAACVEGYRRGRGEH